jgi:hypothetical protein
VSKAWRYLLAAFLAFGLAAESRAASALEQIGEFNVPEANQGVGVDGRHFYAVDNYAIGKYDKSTGKLVKKWQGDKNGPILHLDSALLLDGKLYAAHSNYPQWPMTSSLEIFDAETMAHAGTHSFGIQWGSLTWDRSQPDVIYGIIRATAKERAEGGGHKVTVFRLVQKP